MTHDEYLADRKTYIDGERDYATKGDSVILTVVGFMIPINIAMIVASLNFKPTACTYFITSLILDFIVGVLLVVNYKTVQYSYKWNWQILDKCILDLHEDERYFWLLEKRNNVWFNKYNVVLALNAITSVVAINAIFFLIKGLFYVCSK